MAAPTSAQAGASAAIGPLPADFDRVNERAQRDYLAFRERCAGFNAHRPASASPETLATIVAQIDAAAADGTPYALIRIGDGEGACLLDPDEHGLALTNVVAGSSLALYYGRDNTGPAAYAFWRESLTKAIAQADVIGTFSRAQFEKIIPSTRRVRAAVGVMNAYLAVQTLPIKPGATQFSDLHIHNQLLPHFGALVKGRDVVLVNCYDEAASEAFQTAFGARVVAHVRVPPPLKQAVDLDAQLLFPHRIDGVRAETAAAAAPGRIVLIAAGQFGKELAVVAAQNGAVGLDIGAVMDVWFGEAVRPYHTTDFVKRHRIVQPKGPNITNRLSRAMFEHAAQIDARTYPSACPERVKTTALLSRLVQGLIERCEIATTVEIGTREGTFSRMVKRDFPHCRAIAFEANGGIAEHFGPAARQAGVEYEHFAIAGHNGTVELKVAQRVRERELGPLNGLSSLHARKTVGFEYDVETVPCAELDTAMGERNVAGPLALWIDVEGAQKVVLSKADKTLAQARVVHIEVEDFEMIEGQWSDEDVIAFFLSHGFEVFARDVERANQYNIIFARADAMPHLTHARKDLLTQIEAMARQPAGTVGT